MTDKPASTGSRSPIPVTRLSESFRFDDELASILTTFQYRHDNVSLTSSQTRRLPAETINPSTPGIAATIRSNASLTFLVHDGRGHRTVNPVEVALAQALIDALPLTDSNTTGETPTAAVGVGEGPLADDTSGHRPSGKDNTPAEQETVSTPSTHTQHTTSAENNASAKSSTGKTTSKSLSVGVVTPHNAQRGRLTDTLPDVVTTNTVEKYQGGERDVMIVSGTVSDPSFARQEETFILDPRRLLVAVSRARIKTIVACSDALFQVAPEDSEQLDEGLIWNRLFLLCAGQDPSPAWDGPLADFLTTSITDSQNLPDVQVAVYSSSGDDANETR